MSAFFVATSAIKDPQKFQEYARQAGATLAPHGGETILRGVARDAIAGELDHQAVGVVRFPTLDALTAWFRSAEYQAIVPLRDAAAKVTITTYSVPAANRRDVDPQHEENDR